MKNNYLFNWLIIALLLSITINAQNSSTENLVETGNAEIYVKTIGEGDPLIVVHGGPGLAHNYLFEPFSELSKNHKLIFYDQRGCGLSSPFKEEEKITIDTLVEDLERLRIALNLDKFILAGQSWGAVVAINYTIKFPGNVKKLLLLEPAPGSSEYLQQLQKTIMERLTPVKKERLIKLSQTPDIKTNPLLFKEFLTIRLATYFYDSTKVARLHLDYFDELHIKKFFESSAMFGPYLLNMNLYDMMKNITCQTLILHGEYDVIPNEAIERMGKSIPNAEVHIIKNCGHFIHLENPNEYFGLIKKFLSN